MNETTESLLATFEALVRESTPFCCLVRDEKEQLKYSDRFKDLLTSIRENKEVAKVQMDEESANLLLSVEKMSMAINSELELWICLKREKYDEAWNKLVAAQSSIRWARAAHSIGGTLGAYEDKLHAIERIIFPSLVFFSPAMIVKEAECSICSKNYDECHHVVGRPYMGEICTRIIKDVEVLEVSMVDVPANKLARVMRISDGGFERDYLTWRTIPK